MSLSGYISLDEAKAQCEIELEETAHDAKLRIMLAAAERWAVNFCDVESMEEFVESTGDSPPPIIEDVKLAILMATAHFFENRESVNVGNIVTQVPMSTESLLWPYRNVGV